MTQDALVNKREYLEELEKSEHEARRLGEALARGRLSVPSNQPNQQQNPLTSSSQEIVGEETPDDEPVVEHNQANSWPAALPAHPGPNPARRKMKTPGMGLLNALSYTFHGMMDVDPETARRNSITKTRETISQVKMSTSYLARAKCLTFLTQAGRCSSLVNSGFEVLEFYNPGGPRQVSAAESCRPSGNGN